MALAEAKGTVIPESAKRVSGIHGLDAG